MAGPSRFVDKSRRISRIAMNISKYMKNKSSIYKTYPITFPISVGIINIMMRLVPRVITALSPARNVMGQMSSGAQNATPMTQAQKLRCIRLEM